MTGGGADRSRYCFILPDIARPMGGQAVIYDFAVALEAAGYDVALVHAGPAHRYPFAEAPRQVFHLPDLVRLRARKPLGRRLADLRQYAQEWRRNPRNPRFLPEPRDVYVLPEFGYPNYARLFAGRPQVLFAQDPTALMRAYGQDRENAHETFAAVLATSQVAGQAVEVLLGRRPLRLTLPVSGPGLRADHPKRLQIAYMPRKLRPQSQRVAATLRRRAAFADIPVIAIENMSNAERDRILNESLIFLSFSNMEGFGLPAAEAMAAGCIVVGYTGVGGNEYFTAETGFVVEHHDMIGMVAQLERIVTEYRADPSALDALRAHAAAEIAARYSVEVARETLLNAWETLEKDLCKGPK
ncbi:glycosyltransferase [uncultured Roseobacter sp.]|uniref:glycosyltransferase n=1 Tax=uncultured Roseobacter sp. TaxID=114847 RepID=UPI002613923A|nr:glycosyltransferase [uncultured Roseobacter sp.]